MEQGKTPLDVYNDDSHQKVIAKTKNDVIKRFWVLCKTKLGSTFKIL